jgi:hypothetical protein
MFAQLVAASDRRQLRPLMRSTSSLSDALVASKSGEQRARLATELNKASTAPAVK